VDEPTRSGRTAQWIATVVTMEAAQTTGAPGFWQATIDSVWPAFTPAVEGRAAKASPPGCVPEKPVATGDAQVHDAVPQAFNPV
jgi:hypothetical protein